MKDEIIQALTERIAQELDEIKRVQLRIQEGWQRALRSNDDFYLDSVALNLHGFYMGFERIFAHIAEVIDGSIPQGEKWHQNLLLQMSSEVPSIRPAVISSQSKNALDEYRGFRHIIRNVYTQKLDPEKMKRLVLSAPTVMENLTAEIQAFSSFLLQD